MGLFTSVCWLVSLNLFHLKFQQEGPEALKTDSTIWKKNGCNVDKLSVFGWIFLKGCRVVHRIVFVFGLKRLVNKIVNRLSHAVAVVSRCFVPVASARPYHARKRCRMSTKFSWFRLFF